MNIQVKVVEASKVQRKLTVLIPASEVDAVIEEHFKKVQKTAQVKGFRKGHVPVPMLEKLYGGDVYQRAWGDLVEDSFRKAIMDNQLRPVGRPAIETTKGHQGHVHRGQDLEYVATVEVMPEVTVKSYKGLSVKKEKVEIKDAQVDESVQQIRDSHAQLTSSLDPNEKVEKGHFVDVEFDGKMVQGEELIAKDGMKGSQLLEIGSGRMIPGFEEEVVGLKVSEEKTFRIEFPKDYHEASLQGQTAEFFVKVNELKKKSLPELTDEFAVEAGYESILDMRTKTRKGMEEYYQEDADRKYKNALLEQLIKKNPFEVPGSLVQAQMSSLMQETAQNLKQQGMSEDMIQKGMASETDTYKARAENQVRAGLLLDAVANAEDIKVQNDDIEAEFKQMADQAKVGMDEVRSYYKDAERMENLEFRIREQKAVEIIAAHAK